MKQLLSQLTMLLLSVLVLLLTMGRESEGKRSHGSKEILSQKQVEKTNTSSPVIVAQDSMDEDQSFMLTSPKEGILFGKSMYLWIY